MDDKSKVTVHVTRQYDAPPERVFDAWLDPKTIGTWMFGHVEGEEVVRTSVDARVGGSFSFVVRRQGQELDHAGKYLEIDRPHRLVFTWGILGQSNPDDSRVIIEIAPSGTGSQLTLTHAMAPRWADYADRTRAGWTKITDALAAVVAGK